jgi:hypothetical protein
MLASLQHIIAHPDNSWQMIDGAESFKGIRGTSLDPSSDEGAPCGVRHNKSAGRKTKTSRYEEWHAKSAPCAADYWRYNF